MKKILAFTLSLLVTAISVNNATAASDVDEMDIKILHINPTTRSLMDIPEASIKNHDLFSISFDLFGICTLYIEDSFGAIVYTASFPADGMEYSYDLSGIGKGLHRLVIKGPGGEFEGYFTLY